jgi:hypothetical protein
MRGSCVCGAVAFEVEGPIRDGVACHCGQCRKNSGHYWVASSVPLERFRLIRDEGLVWYAASDQAGRGFCRHCGAFLLWKPAGEDRMGFALGAIEGPTGVRIARQIFVEDAGDYYAPEGPPPHPGTPGAQVRASCHCGGVAFDLPRPEGGVGACHCTQCRKLSGHYSASFDAAEEEVAFLARGTLAEFATAGGARRGFCTRCGSSLYFRAADGAFSVEAGAVDGPTGLSLDSHIFVADKGDYYQIDDGLPQHPGAG